MRYCAARAAAGPWRAHDRDGHRHRRQPVELFPRRSKDEVVDVGMPPSTVRSAAFLGGRPARPPEAARSFPEHITSGSRDPQAVGRLSHHPTVWMSWARARDFLVDDQRLRRIRWRTRRHGRAQVRSGLSSFVPTPELGGLRASCQRIEPANRFLRKSKSLSVSTPTTPLKVSRRVAAVKASPM